jgi:DNA-binding transcriptional LysR family regulator
LIAAFLGSCKEAVSSGGLLELKDLKYFVAVYEANSFMRASISLATVQSNVSFRIKRLEEDLGTTLFVRLRRGVKPTTKGDLFYRYAKEVLGKIEEAKDMVKRPNAA